MPRASVARPPSVATPDRSLAATVITNAPNAPITRTCGVLMPRLRRVAAREREHLRLRRPREAPDVAQRPRGGQQHREDRQRQEAEQEPPERVRRPGRGGE